MVLCRECGLTHNDLEHMTFGMALDYIDEYLDMKNPEGKKDSGKVVEFADQVPWL